MSASGMMFLLASVVMAPAPAKPKDGWVGLPICGRESGMITYERKTDGTFEPKPFYMRYLDVRAIAEDGEYVQVQHDADTIWVQKKDMLRPKDAILYYTRIMEKTPDDQRAISCRCWAYMAVNDYDRALKDAEEAVRLSPNSPAWKNNRGEVYIKRKEYDKAITEFTNLLNAVPQYFFALHNRSEAYLRTKQFAKALDDIDACLANEGKVPMLHVNKARILATAPDPKIRNGKKALESATLALEQIKYRDGRALEAMAAAHAELGNFDKAVDYQQRALDDSEYLKEEGDGPRQRLKLYREKKPFRDE
ncbi:tetratricopeptide repeat protein [Zavarzinella formosa]|uniref:tetratricopeptide repeat protein n=1 Tax=Zavarzinella formosa TaxID=360055 RepID=UPI0002DB58CA|nr:tetratricopeptide repeat protein [Zavarzinella formosa]